MGDRGQEADVALVLQYMILLRRLPALLALLLLATLLEACEDSLLPAPQIPGEPIDTVVLPENGHILFSRLDASNFPLIVTSLEYTDTFGSTPSAIDPNGVMTAKPGDQLMAFQTLPPFGPIENWVSDHLGGDRQKLDLVFANESLIEAAVAISPDGTKLAYATQDFTTGQIKLWYVTRTDLGFVSPTLIDAEFAYLSVPAWSRDGSKIAYFTQTFDDQLRMTIEEYGFAVAEIGQGTPTPRRIVNGEFTLESGETIDWSPISDEVIFTAETNLYSHTWNVPGYQQFPNWMHGAFSPDGKFVAVVDVVPGQRLAIIDWSNKSSTPLDVPPLAQYPGWSPDGKYLIYTRTDIQQSDSELRLVEIADPKNTRSLASGFVGRGFWVKQLMF